MLRDLSVLRPGRQFQHICQLSRIWTDISLRAASNLDARLVLMASSGVLVRLVLWKLTSAARGRASGSGAIMDESTRPTRPRRAPRVRRPAAGSSLPHRRRNKKSKSPYVLSET
eukprot:902962-Prymnesium_polylepis.1